MPTREGDAPPCAAPFDVILEEDFVDEGESEVEGGGNDGNGAMAVGLVGLFKPLGAPAEDQGDIVVVP